MNLNAFLVSLVPMVSWGFMNLFVGIISKRKGALEGAFLIQLIALIISFLLWPIFKEVPNEIDWLTLVLSSVSGMLAYVFFMKALEHGNVSVITVITSGWAVISAIFGVIFLGEKLTLIDITGIFLVVFGVILLSVDWYQLRNGKSWFNKESLYSLIALFGWGYAFYALGPLTVQMGWPFVSLMGRFLTFIFLGSIVLITSIGGGFSFKGLFKADLKLSFVILAAVCTDLVAYAFYNIGVSKYPVSIVSVVSSAAPVVTILASSLILKEKTSRIQKLGMLLAIVGVLIMQV